MIDKSLIQGINPDVKNILLQSNGGLSAYFYLGFKRISKTDNMKTIKPLKLRRKN